MPVAFGCPHSKEDVGPVREDEILRFLGEQVGEGVSHVRLIGHPDPFDGIGSGIGEIRTAHSDSSDPESEILEIVIVLDGVVLKEDGFFEE